MFNKAYISLYILSFILFGYVCGAFAGTLKQPNIEKIDSIQIQSSIHSFSRQKEIIDTGQMSQALAQELSDWTDSFLELPIIVRQGKAVDDYSGYRNPIVITVGVTLTNKEVPNNKGKYLGALTSSLNKAGSFQQHYVGLVPFIYSDDADETYKAITDAYKEVFKFYFEDAWKCEFAQLCSKDPNQINK